MLPGDRLVCAFVQPAEAGMTFSAWPLHVTVVPWFRLALDSAELAERLRRLLADIAPFEAAMGGQAKFGYRGRKLVSLVRTPSPLGDIEQRVRGFLHAQNAWLADETTKRRRPFRQHLTAQGPSSRSRSGDRFAVGELYIVEQKGEYKQVAALVPLGVQ